MPNNSIIQSSNNLFTEWLNNSDRKDDYDDDKEDIIYAYFEDINTFCRYLNKQKLGLDSNNEDIKNSFDDMKSDVEDELDEMDEDQCSYYATKIMICALKYLIEQPNILETIIFEYPKINIIKDENIIHSIDDKITFGEFYRIWLNQNNDETYIESCNIDENEIDLVIDN
jgi:hypothetical protein